VLRACVLAWRGARRLLEAGADGETLDKWGTSARDNAAAKERHEVVALLARAAGDTDAARDATASSKLAKKLRPTEAERVQSEARQLSERRAAKEARKHSTARKSPQLSTCSSAWHSALLSCTLLTLACALCVYATGKMLSNAEARDAKLKRAQAESKREAADRALARALVPSAAKKAASAAAAALAGAGTRTRTPHANSTRDATAARAHAVCRAVSYGWSLLHRYTLPRVLCRLAAWAV
jgi:hypothetical protein